MGEIGDEMFDEMMKIKRKFESQLKNDIEISEIYWNYFQKMEHHWRQYVEKKKIMEQEMEEKREVVNLIDIENFTLHEYQKIMEYE